MAEDSVLVGDFLEPEHELLGPEEAQRAACTYISRGWAVTAGPGLDTAGICACGLGKRCRNPGKHAYAGWGNETRKTLTYEQAERYWSPGNSAWRDKPVDQVFIVPYLSGLVVADVDNEAAWELIDAGSRPETLTQQSGSGRGGHRLYKFEWDVGEKFPPSLPGRLPNGAGEVKFRGIIAAAPSVHKGGGRYKWVDWNVPIVDAPSILTEKPERYQMSEASWEAVQNADPNDRWINLEYLADREGLEQAGRAITSRPLVLFAVAASMSKWIAAGRISEEEVVDALIESAERNGALDTYGRSDMERQIKNGIQTGMTEKRS